MIDVDLRIKKKPSQQHSPIAAEWWKVFFLFFWGGKGVGWRDGRPLLSLSLSKWWRKKKHFKTKVKILHLLFFFFHPKLDNIVNSVLQVVSVN